jgi:hypothetical protein
MAEAKQQPQAAAVTAGVWKTIKPFVNGGASGMLATCVIQPIDMVKVNPYAARPVFFLLRACFRVRWGAGIFSGSGWLS